MQFDEFPEFEPQCPTDSVMKTAQTVNSDHELEIDIEEVLMDDDDGRYVGFENTDSFLLIKTVIRCIVILC